MERDKPDVLQLFYFRDFNSHAHVERDAVVTSKLISIFSFQLTRSRGAWHRPWNFCATGKIFQLTRSRGAWRFSSKVCLDHMDFNSHAHVERDKLLPLFQSQLLHFNSHAHVERDRIIIYIHNLGYISTHTLTWSVTHLTKYFCSLLRISTHTLTWSVTEKFPTINTIFDISTHTLTWSVTIAIEMFLYT